MAADLTKNGFSDAVINSCMLYYANENKNKNDSILVHEN